MAASILSVCLNEKIYSIILTNVAYFKLNQTPDGQQHVSVMESMSPKRNVSVFCLVGTQLQSTFFTHILSAFLFSDIVCSLITVLELF